MIDLHCHILPGVDDGASSLDEAFALARFCMADGISHVFATPHCHRYVHWLRAEIVPKVDELNRELANAEISLTIHPGSEVQVTDTTEYRREFEAGLYCHYGDAHAFTLLEFNWARDLFPADAVELVKWICAQGTTPILAHPERHNYFSQEAGLLRGLIDAGAWVQVTVDSLLGNHGPAPRVAGEAMLREYPLAVLATDAHRLTRCSGLSAGFEWVRKNLGDNRAADLQARAEEVLKRST